VFLLLLVDPLVMLGQQAAGLRNKAMKQHRLGLSPAGSMSNRLGIGARAVRQCTRLIKAGSDGDPPKGQLTKYALGAATAGGAVPFAEMLTVMRQPRIFGRVFADIAVPSR